MSNSSKNEVLVARNSMGNSSTEEVLIEDISSHHDALIGETLMKLQNASTPEEIFETSAKSKIESSDKITDCVKSDINANEIDKPEEDALDALKNKELHVSIVKASISGDGDFSNDQSKKIEKEKLLVNILNIKDNNKEHDVEDDEDKSAGNELVVNIIKMMVCLLSEDMAMVFTEFHFSL